MMLILRIVLFDSGDYLSDGRIVEVIAAGECDGSVAISL